MATKINEFQKSTVRGGVMTSGFLAENGIGRSEQLDYVKSGWLERLSHGVYRFRNDELALIPTLVTLSEQSGLSYHVGGYSALELHGYTHFVAMQELPLCVFTLKDRMLPQWMKQHDWGRELLNVSTQVFGDIGVTEKVVDGVRLRLSSPERAMMECLLMAPERYGLMDLYYVMEMLNTLRPKLVGELLESCSSVKVKRLFLYMAEKAGHPWWKRLELSGLSLGSGPRSFTKGGVKVAKYNIVIPRELAEYEQVVY